MQQIPVARNCDSCTACCDGWLQMEIAGNQVSPGCPCPYSTGSGCSNYANRPKDPCINFNCGWVMENSPMPDWMKPSTGKVIMIFNKLVWHGAYVDLAVPVGEKIPEESLNWLKQFAAENFRPLIYLEQQLVDGKLQSKQQAYSFGPPAFQQDVLRWQAEGRKFW